VKSFHSTTCVTTKLCKSQIYEKLPEAMGSIFSVFHVSQLKKCLRVPEERVEPQGIRIKSDLEYREQSVRVLDTKDQVTQNKVVRTYKIQWSHHDDGDETWETGEYLWRRGVTNAGHDSEAASSRRSRPSVAPP
jgi:hypothetical protein